MPQLFSRHYWKEVFREQLLIARAKPLPRAALSWHLDESILKAARIIWPKSYSWKPAKKWLDPIRRGLAAHLPLVESDIHRDSNKEQYDEDPTFSCILEHSGRELLVTIDYSDYPEISPSIASQSDCYFKMQYRKEGYAEHGSILPGGFVSGHAQALQFANELRRKTPDERYELYGRFSVEFATDVRRAAIGLLNEQQEFAFEGSLKRVRYSRFLEEAYHSKLCLDLPGNGVFCFRLIDYFALGCAIIAPEHRNRLHVELVPGKQLLYCKEDLSDLVELTAKVLRDRDMLTSLRQESRLFFDRYLHHEQLAAYYLCECFKRL